MGISLGSLVQIVLLVVLMLNSRKRYRRRHASGSSANGGWKKKPPSSLVDLHPPFLQWKPELDANGQWRHEMPTDRQEGPFELEAVDMRHEMSVGGKRQELEN